MRLNTIKPAAGARTARKRVGRGIGSGLGKTCGRGHKGQKSRSGGGVQIGFEGGQMPLQKRLPKVGFTSRTKRTSSEVRLSELQKMSADQIDLTTLKKEGILPQYIQSAKIIKSGEITRSVSIQGVGVTAGAKAAIEAAGGKVEV